jgi:hypothetical protein
MKHIKLFEQHSNEGLADLFKKKPAKDPKDMDSLELAQAIYKDYKKFAAGKHRTQEDAKEFVKVISDEYGFNADNKEITKGLHDFWMLPSYDMEHSEQVMYLNKVMQQGGIKKAGNVHHQAADDLRFEDK